MSVKFPFHCSLSSCCLPLRYRPKSQQYSRSSLPILPSHWLLAFASLPPGNLSLINPAKNP